MLGPESPVTHLCIPEEQIPQAHLCENLKTCSIQREMSCDGLCVALVRKDVGLCAVLVRKEDGAGNDQ